MTDCTVHSIDNSLGILVVVRMTPKRMAVHRCVLVGMSDDGAILENVCMLLHHVCLSESYLLDLLQIFIFSAS